jgi:hypothetical protein
MKKNDRSVRPDEALVVQPKAKRACNVAMLEHAFSKYTRQFFAKIGTWRLKKLSRWICMTVAIFVVI